jgi:hypothetical protein
MAVKFKRRFPFVQVSVNGEATDCDGSGSSMRYVASNEVDESTAAAVGMLSMNRHRVEVRLFSLL